MGWGISIPSLGIDTRSGSYFGINGGPQLDIGGDIGKFMENASREANTPVGRTLIGSALMGPGAGIALGVGSAWDQMNKNSGTWNGPSGDYNSLKSRWDTISNQQTTEGVRQGVQSAQEMGAVGTNTGQSALAQAGGLGIGAKDRMNRTSKWDQALTGAGINQSANIKKDQLDQQRILGLDIPIEQGVDMANAYAQSADRLARSRNNGMIGGIIGGAAGAYAGGPSGAMAGYNLGSGVGSGF